MEKMYKSSAARLDGREVGTFCQIAVRTGKRKILRVVRSTVLPRHDVLNMETKF